jgi:anti-sigma-K factor RskA
MREMNCAEVQDAAAEFALDILDSEDRSIIAAHLIRCSECRAEVDSMQETFEHLLDLVPGTEPPLGFDRRVMKRVDSAGGRTRRRWRAVVGAAAAALLIVVGVTMGAVATHSSHPATPHLVSAPFIAAGGRQVGQIDVYAADRPPWVSMTVRGVDAKGPVSCELIDRDGTVTPLGSFDLVNGMGSWGAPDRWTDYDIAGARLVDASGQVVARASF